MNHDAVSLVRQKSERWATSQNLKTVMEKCALCNGEKKWVLNDIFLSDLDTFSARIFSSSSSFLPPFSLIKAPFSRLLTIFPSNPGSPKKSNRTFLLIHHRTSAKEKIPLRHTHKGSGVFFRDRFANHCKERKKTKPLGRIGFAGGER